jgi:hypothetical protein
LSSRTREGRDAVRIARSDREVTKVLLDARRVVVSCGRSGRGGQFGHVDLAISAERVRGRLQVGLVGEEEDERAGLAGVGGRDVKVEDGRDGGRNLAIVRRAFGGVGRRGVNRHDQVRVLVVAGEGSRAARAGGRRRTRSSSRRGDTMYRSRGRRCYGDGRGRPGVRSDADRLRHGHNNG